jgi:hypothetical protein
MRVVWKKNKAVQKSIMAVAPMRTSLVSKETLATEADDYSMDDQDSRMTFWKARPDEQQERAE